MNVFDLREKLIRDYSAYTQSFLQIRDDRIRDYANEKIAEGLLWPEALIQLNPSFEAGSWVDELVDSGELSGECRNIFRIKTDDDPVGHPLRLHKHQEDAIRVARNRKNYILTTGTGSGKSLAYIIPIVDHVIRLGTGRGIQAIIVYPMNALANSQLGELDKFINLGYPGRQGLVKFARYTGQENDEKREEIIANPPDIILTNYVMLEYILTRPRERDTLVKAAQGLKYLVLDELHTYRGRQGADVALLVRRVRDALHADDLQCVGTSATVAGKGTFSEQQEEVSKVAEKLFGSTVNPESVIGETLRRETEELDFNDKTTTAQLSQIILRDDHDPAESYDQFINSPLASWIENSVGIQRNETDQFIRNVPKTISEMAATLSNLTEESVESCGKAITACLLDGFDKKNPETGFPAFAFRLHQFISRGDTVYSSLESPQQRHITVQGQRYTPNRPDTPLFPLAFCRQCGQEYYVVLRRNRKDDIGYQFEVRELRDRTSDDQGESGFLYINQAEPWPANAEESLDRVPTEWLEDHRGQPRIKRDRRKYTPTATRVNAAGAEDKDGYECAFFPAPFRFCLSCGVSYGFRQTSDFAKLAQLGSEGRSTATTILSLAVILGLNDVDGIRKEAKKLLSFTDNRQEAALQAGHFNDFIEVGLLRASLFNAVLRADKKGIEHDGLGEAVFNALDPSKEMYANDPEVRFHAETETKRAFRDVLCYRLYRDLRRGWRIVAPNLEQCGLLEIRYHSLQEACEAEDLWQGRHVCLVDSSPEQRATIVKVLLDYMRRELAVKVDYLDPDFQDRLKQRSNQHLKLPWAIDENERLEHATVIFPRPGSRDDHRGFVHLSPRGGFGQYLARKYSGAGPNRLSLDDRQQIIEGLLDILKSAGLVEEVETRNETPGYQVPAASMLWVVGDGTRPFHDPIRVLNEPEGGSRTNPFFLEFYKNIALNAKGINAKEHTAQVPYEDRVARENTFRKEPEKLPILFCSPTMELGIDIAELNVVNLRNIPPTPANYAQRSGRAGRSGQPALVFSYCTTGSSHDQYFFKRPQQMVTGAVNPPRLDLGNEDLVKAHIQAIWLAASGLDLGSSLKEVLDIEGAAPSLQLLEHVEDAIQSERAIQAAKVAAAEILTTLGEDLKQADWYTEDWLGETLNKIPLSFRQATERWVGLYESALKQSEIQSLVIRDAARPTNEKKRAARLRREAEQQLELLSESANVMQSDFYSYRYFASEGFLPGYNFPRLPLSAYIAARRQKDEFISRPRFLAISEFGPRAIVYHEGSHYIINRVIMPPREDGGAITTEIKRCSNCGYIHPADRMGIDLCEYCNSPLDQPIRSLFRVQNVSTKRRDRINSDEEERQRLGYEMLSGIRFATHADGLSRRVATVRDGENVLAQLTYGQAATLWRINLGWRRRQNRNLYGFVLDTERGYWKRNELNSEEEDPEDPMTEMTERVVPFVEDRRNCLLIEPVFEIDDKERIDKEMASLQAILKNAIQVLFQLEENELAAESLPSIENRKSILLYEAAEGGAGVLRRLIDDPVAISQIATEALKICHFSPDTGDDERRAPGMEEDCEAACYNCMMSYSNQREHDLLNRHLVKEWLLKFQSASVVGSPIGIPRAEHIERLSRQSGSGLERRWLKFLEDNQYSLPSHAQRFVEECKTRPDFSYLDSHVLIYVDGPPHDYPARQLRDQEQMECLEDLGYEVIRFHHEDNWAEIAARHPHVFGMRQ